MDLPDLVAIKFNIYTLACSEMQARLINLSEATQSDLRLPYEICISRFNEALLKFFERSSAADLVQAAKSIGDRLHTEVGDISDKNKIIATIFEEVISAIHTKAQSWDYLSDIGRLHSQGVDLAKLFFAESPCPLNNENLEITCRLTYENNISYCENQSISSPEPFGFKGAPIAFRPNWRGEEQEERPINFIIARFNFNHDLTLYLSYPYLFLHEYTAHIYANDFGNERFNDGWMLHAAAYFLQRFWNRKQNHIDLQRDQANIFYDHLYQKIRSIPFRACRFAKHFDDWLFDSIPGKFTQITYELASFVPQKKEKEFWPNQLINALESEFMTNRKRLLAKLRAADNLRELMTMLSNV